MFRKKRMGTLLFQDLKFCQTFLHLLPQKIIALNITRNKKKIINDPVFGFISIQSDLVFDIIEHPWFQRLRRIRQLGLSYLVFPGANHTRFEHSIGAVHLVQEAVDSLRLKGHTITDEEAEAVVIAILLHDIGHGPFSHVLENALVETSHEEISALAIARLNSEFGNRLALALEIFENRYPKKFLHQLVSGQLDMDRLDYLARDSFFTGVVEGVVGIDRIIKMLEVEDDRLVIESKGVYSIEKFLIARRLMYWQVYLHKTVMAADTQLLNLLKRAADLAQQGQKPETSSALGIFLKNRFSSEDFINDKKINGKGILEHFMDLDDNDIFCMLKSWQNHPDFILSYLAQSLVNRKLFVCKLTERQGDRRELDNIGMKICEQLNISLNDLPYFLTCKEVTNSAYNKYSDEIYVIGKDGNIKDIRHATDVNLSVLTKVVRKFFISYPKELVVN